MCAAELGSAAADDECVCGSSAAQMAMAGWPHATQEEAQRQWQQQPWQPSGRNDAHLGRCWTDV